MNECTHTSYNVEFSLLLDLMIFLNSWKPFRSISVFFSPIYHQCEVICMFSSSALLLAWIQRQQQIQLETVRWMRQDSKQERPEE